MASAPGRETARSTRRRTMVSDDTRLQILSAAIASINEAGYYRGASSNAIAKRAGLTWGVIQHYFGNRKGLLLAVLENELEEAIDSLTAAEVVGETVEQRLRSVIEILFDFFGQPGYNAILQIIWDLSRDPDVEETTHAALAKFQRHYFALMRGLLRRVPINGAAIPDGVDGLVMDVAGGLAVVQMGRTQFLGVKHSEPDPHHERQLLVKALATLFEDEGADGQGSKPRVRDGGRRTRSPRQGS